MNKLYRTVKVELNNGEIASFKIGTRRLARAFEQAIENKTKGESQMKSIYKYQLEVKDYQEIQMPVDAEILDIQMQHDIICIWAMVDPGCKLITKKFRIFGTGQQITDYILSESTYLKTVLTRTHLFVWHVFEAE